MNKLKFLADNIEKCEGGIVNIIGDNNPINVDFMEAIKYILNKQYKIIEIQKSTESLEHYLQYKFTLKKTIIIIKYRNDIKKLINILNNIRNKNVIFFLISDSESNIIYESLLIIKLKQKHMNILKNRYPIVDIYQPRFSRTQSESISLDEILCNFYRRIKIQTLNEK